MKAILSKDAYLLNRVTHVSVVQEGDNEPYFAFLTTMRSTSRASEAQARSEGRKVLYRVNILTKRLPEDVSPMRPYCNRQVR